MILTDEEITKVFNDLCDTDHCTEMFDYLYARAIEAAVMAKFEVVTLVEQPMYGTLSNEITKHLPPFTQLYALKEKP